MTEQIAEKLVTTIGGIIPTFYSEAETDVYPYCVFSQEVTPTRNKDGVYKLVSDCTVEVWSNSFDEADEKADAIKEAVSASMNDTQFASVLASSDKSCDDGIWVISMSYTITQKS